MTLFSPGDGGPAPLGTRPEHAREALDSGDLPDVVTAEAALGDADVGVWFSDLLAHEFSDLVEATVPIVQSAAGVTRAAWENREFIAVYGAAVDRDGLQATVQGWWVERLRAIANGEPRALP